MSVHGRPWNGYNMGDVSANEYWGECRQIYASAITYNLLFAVLPASYTFGKTPLDFQAFQQCRIHQKKPTQ